MSTARPPVSLALALLGAGCLSQTGEIRAYDNDVPLPTVRASTALVPPPEGDEGSGRAWSTWLDLDLNAGRGERPQSLGDGQSVTLGGTTIAGPGEMQVEFELYRAVVDVRASLRSGDGTGFGFDALAGLQVAQMDLDMYLGGARAREGLFSVGPIVGLGASWAPDEVLRLHLDGTLSPMWATDQGTVELATLDAAVSYRATDELQIVGGWRWTTYDFESDPVDASDVDLKLSGPRLGIELRF